LQRIGFTSLDIHSQQNLILYKYVGENMSQSDSKKLKIAKVNDPRASIESILAPNKAMLDILKAIQPPAYLSIFEQYQRAILPITDITKMFQPSIHLTALAQVGAAMQRDYSELGTSLMRPSSIVGDFAKQFAQMRIVSESMTAQYGTLHAILQSQSKIFENLSINVAAMESAKFNIAQFSQTALVWNLASLGLVNRMNDIGLLAHEALSTRLFENLNTYTSFVRDTTNLLATDPAPNIAARLRGSLNLAEYQIAGIADTVSAFVVIPEDNEELDVIRVLDAPYRQQDELLRYEFTQNETDTSSLIYASPTAQTAQKGRRILELVTQCNEAGKMSPLGVEIFKPTTRLLTVFSDFPWLSAGDRSQFGEVVDCLYFIFYEGAGKDNLRFLEKNGGPLNEDIDCDLIWCIKHLRNKWSRHDADHGAEKDIRKSWDQLAAKFRWLGLAASPTNSSHFQQLHDKLLMLSEEFLKRILDKLTLK
jgi:hypothetical protein